MARTPTFQTAPHALRALRPAAAASRCKTRASGLDFPPVDLTPNTPPRRLNALVSPLLDALNGPAPAPVVLSRKQLDRDFAVLLMRSGYNAVDALDFVAMDEFQKRFFDIRSREWEQFIKVNLGMRQGVIDDARYFDFISYAQMLTVHHFVRAPRALFEERFEMAGGGFDVRVVQRDAQRLPDARSVLEAWRVAAGDLMFEKVRHRVGDGLVVERVKRVYAFLVAAGFCLECRVADLADGVRVEMVAPCILWSAKALRKKRSIANDYDCFLVLSLCRECETTAHWSTELNESCVVRQWRFGSNVPV